LDEEGLLNAWGIAYSQAAGNGEAIASGGLTKRLQAGFAANGGILAALLANKGVSGAKNSLEGKAGLFNLYQRGEYDPKALTEALGERFEVMNLSYKPFPCCRFNHSSIEAALKIANQNSIKPRQIKEVKVGVSRAGFVFNCEPLDVKRRPRNVVDAQFSIPYAVASALVAKRAGLAEFTEDSIKDATVLKIASKVYPFVDPEIEREAGREIAPARVEVKTKGGGVYSSKVSVPKGHPNNQMTDEEFKTKFRSCASFGVKGVSLKAVDRLIDALNHLEQVDDVKQVTKLFKLKI
jgi:2-methylcitrate dehydratase PrpD